MPSVRYPLPQKARLPGPSRVRQGRYCLPGKIR